MREISPACELRAHRHLDAIISFMTYVMHGVTSESIDAQSDRAKKKFMKLWNCPCNPTEAKIQLHPKRRVGQGSFGPPFKTLFGPALQTVNSSKWLSASRVRMSLRADAMKGQTKTDR